MANITINDILDELREYNEKLYNENNVIFYFLEKYRQFSIDFHKSCFCGSKSDDFESLEDKYQRIANQISFNKSVDQIDNSLELTSIDIKSESIDKSLKTIKNVKKSVRKSLRQRKENESKSTEDIETEGDDQFDGHSDNDWMDSDYEGSDQSFHGKELFECEECHQMLTGRSGLNQHKRTVHSPDPTVHKCQLCPFTSKWPKSLERHLKRKHPTENRFKCLRCDQLFRTKAELLEHKSTHPRPKKHKCEECLKMFTKRSLMRKHWDKIHSLNPTLYDCKHCDFRTKYTKTLKLHIDRTHVISEATIKCDNEDCPKTFKTAFLMKVHWGQHHKEWLCDWPGCGHISKSFRQCEDHRRQHLGVRDFKCDVEGCSMSFFTPWRLEGHKRIHQQRFACSWPGCERRFGQSKGLEAHLNRHQGLRPHVCDFIGCGKGFYSSHNLWKHRRTLHNI